MQNKLASLLDEQTEKKDGQISDIEKRSPPNRSAQKMHLRYVRMQKMRNHFASIPALVLLVSFAISFFASELRAQNAFIARSCFHLGDRSSSPSGALDNMSAPLIDILTNFEGLREDGEKQNTFSFFGKGNRIQIPESARKILMDSVRNSEEKTKAVIEFLVSVFGKGSKNFRSTITGSESNIFTIAGREFIQDEKRVNMISFFGFAFIDAFQVRKKFDEVEFNLSAVQGVNGQVLSPAEKFVSNQRVIEVEVNDLQIRIVTERPNRNPQFGNPEQSFSKNHSVQEIRFVYQESTGLVSLAVSNYKTFYGFKIPGTTKDVGTVQLP